MNVYEMEGFLRGKCLPGDLLVGESHAAYLVRKLNESATLKADRDALAQRADALAVENAAMRKAITFATAPDMWIEQHDGMLDYRYHEWYVDVLNAAIETPPTDAALAAIRVDAMAEGAEACVRALVTSDDDDFSDAPNICAMVAYQLREGK